MHCSRYICVFNLLSFQFQTKLVNVTESISNKLSYFTELEKIGNQINSLTVSRAGKNSLVSTLARLDDCINFIENHVCT